MYHHSFYAKTRPAAPAFVMGNTGEIVTRAEYDRRVNRVAQYFKDIGDRKSVV